MTETQGWMIIGCLFAILAIIANHPKASYWFAIGSIVSFGMNLIFAILTLIEKLCR